ncbi:MAG: hypothetical protein ABUS56_11955 [Acidobacteriota bacterium]
MEAHARVGIDVCGAGGPGDPDGARAAALLCAYFEAEDARLARRRVWRTVAVGGLAVWAFDTVTPILNRVDLAFGLSLVAGAVVASGATEWRARRALGALVAGRIGSSAQRLG